MRQLDLLDMVAVADDAYSCGSTTSLTEVKATPAAPGQTLRPYQIDAIAAVRREFEAGKRSTLLLMGVGTGKTSVFSEVIRQQIAAGGRALVLAHRSELLQQAKVRLASFGIEAQLEQASNRAGLARAVVASVQTLQGKRLRSWARDAFDLVVADEAHHYVSRTHRDILDHFATARVLGVTATGDRADGDKLGRIFHSVAYQYDLRKAIKDGWLAPIRAQRVRVDVELDEVGTKCGDLNDKQLGEQMTRDQVVDGVALPLLELAGDRPTVVFAVNVLHAQKLALALNRQRPGCAVAVSGASKEDERKQAALDLASGKVQFVANAMLWTEGFDLPAISCVAIARPTQSRALFVQMVGRGTRLHPGKSDCLVLDFTGNSTRHKLVTAIDILGDELPTDVRERAAKRLDAGDADVLDAIDEAERDLAAEREAAARKREEEANRKIELAPEVVHGWKAQEVHDLLDLDFDVDALNPGQVWQPASEGQLAMLHEAGIAGSVGMSKAEASRILNALAQRKRAGLATYKQVRLLARWGIDAKTMSKSEASRIIGDRLGNRTPRFGR